MPLVCRTSAEVPVWHANSVRSSDAVPHTRLVRVYDGRDPETKERNYLNQTTHGGLQNRALGASYGQVTVGCRQIPYAPFHRRTGIAAADFSRIRNANLGRFTVNRLMSILNLLGSRVEIKVRIRPVALQEARV